MIHRTIITKLFGLSPFLCRAQLRLPSSYSRCCWKGTAVLCLCKWLCFLCESDNTLWLWTQSELMHTIRMAIKWAQVSVCMISIHHVHSTYSGLSNFSLLFVSRAKLFKPLIWQRSGEDNQHNRAPVGGLLNSACHRSVTLLHQDTHGCIIL